MSGETPDKGEVAVAVQPEGLLVTGDHQDVENYVARLRELAGHSVESSPVNKAAIGGAVGVAGDAAGLLGQSAKFVQLSSDSIKALKAGKLVQGDHGFYRMMIRGADGKFLKQLQWKPTSVNPQRLMSVQMIAVQIALSSAIAEVDESVQRVEGKVDSVLQLAEATRAGDVIGHNETVTRMVRYIESHGSLPTAMWDSVASLGPVLAATVEQLRNHASRVLGSLDAGESVSERAKLLQQAVKDKKLPETLNLLVAAEDSLYKWQRLLVARVGATEHHHLQRVIDDSRALLARQLELDGELYQNAKSAIEAVSRTNDIDGFRWLSVQKLNRDRDTLRSALDEFAGARRHQVESWQELTTPGVRVATSASVKIARKTTGRALSSAGERLTRLGDNLVDRESPERKRAAPPQRNPSDD